jgi:D-alanyl-D-alanine carboxypeptidase
VRERADWIEPRELVQAAEREGALFCPGQSWSYTNTGYTVLGLIIEEITQRPYEEVLLERVLAVSSSPPLDVVHIAEPLTVRPPVNNESDEVGLDADLRTPWAAGAVVGSPEAMALAWRRFLQGDIVPPGSLRRMFSIMYPMFGSYVETYGLGVMVYDLHEADPTQTDHWFGHSGGGLGYQTVVAWSQETGITIAVALQNPERGSAEAVALAMLGVMR